MLRLLAGFDQFSFWLGFLAAIIFLWLYRRIVPVISELWKQSRKRATERLSSLKLGVEYDYRNDFIRYIQGVHLAAPLFSLREILVPPSLLAPPALVDPNEELQSTDTFSRILPYMPEFPEFASVFGAEKLTLVEALSKGANLAMMGAPGSGKTIALAHLGTQIASLSPDAGSLADLVPLYIHAADLKSFLVGVEDATAPITAVISNSGYLSRKTSARFPALMQTIFAEERALLLLDGVDELSSAGVERISEYLKVLLSQHPGLRVVAAVSPIYYDGITALGLVPVTIAGWTHAEMQAFIRNWGKRWQESIDANIWDHPDTGVEESMLYNWLSETPGALTPIEITLRTWAAFAGDSLGSRNMDFLDAYVRRIAGGVGGGDTALERIAMQMVLTNRPVPPIRAAMLWSRGQMEDFTDTELTEIQMQETPEDDSTPGRVGRGVVAALVESGVLINRGTDQVSFSHPVLTAYFASRGIANSAAAGALAAQPEWWLKQWTMHYLAAQIDISPILKALETPDPLHFSLLGNGKWLRDIKPKSEGQLMIMRSLATLFQDDKAPAAMRQRAIAALALSGDPGIVTLSKRLLESKDFLVRSMCALVLGYDRDEKHIPDLTALLSDPSFPVRTAACYALILMQTQAAIETVATVLLHGDEDTQRAAAEALSIDPRDGIELLKEAVDVEDLLVRRAAMYGLGRTRTADARSIIERLQLNDEQWIVRNAAAQEMQRFENGSPAIPRKPLPLHETGWLISFSGESGEGISPGRFAEEVLARALAKGNHEQVLAAMDRYRLDGSEEIWDIVYKIIESSHSEIQTSAILTLWHLRAQGITG